MTKALDRQSVMIQNGEEIFCTNIAGNINMKSALPDIWAIILVRIDIFGNYLFLCWQVESNISCTKLNVCAKLKSGILNHYTIVNIYSFMYDRES